MSVVGQSRRFGDVRATSALPPKADIHREVRHVRLVPILLQKSKFERPGKSRESRVLDSSTAARLCMADTKVVVVFVGNDMVPHVAARGAPQQSLKSSCFTR